MPDTFNVFKNEDAPLIILVPKTCNNDDGFVIPIPTLPLDIILNLALEIAAFVPFVAVFSKQKCKLERDQLVIPCAIIAHFKSDVSLKPVPKYNIALPTSVADLIDALLL